MVILPIPLSQGIVSSVLPTSMRANDLSISFKVDTLDRSLLPLREWTEYAADRSRNETCRERSSLGKHQQGLHHEQEILAFERYRLRLVELSVSVSPDQSVTSAYLLDTTQTKTPLICLRRARHKETEDAYSCPLKSPNLHTLHEVVLS